MVVEYLVAFYLLVSVSLIAFNLAVALTEGARGHVARRRERRLVAKVDALMACGGGMLSGRDAERLLRGLRHPAGMEAFDHALEGLAASGPEPLGSCLVSLAPVLERVALSWQAGRDGHDLERAFACYLVRRWYVVRPAPQRLLHALLALVNDGTFYVRQNALQALAALGNAPALVEAVESAQGEQGYHHPRLLTEALMAFEGDAGELAFLLESRLAGLRPYAQVAVVNYLRMAHLGDRDGLLMLMDDEGADAEVRLACIRYFMTNPWEGAWPSLVRYAGSTPQGRWQAQAVAATALGSYPGDATVGVLEGCLTSPVWFVRNNAAASLRRLGVGAQEALEAAGDDAYARDMVRYRWGLGSEGART